MDHNKIGLSVILPTINEGKNLKLLIPQIYKTLLTRNVIDSEILVMDDGSIDDTQDIVMKLSEDYPSTKIINRDSLPSLPMSIWDGIQLSTKNYVMWLDADGSMTPQVIDSMIEIFIEDVDQVVIGSRFAKNGGYKGVQSDNSNFFSALNRVYQSEDSILAVFLSKIFNNSIRLFLNCGVKDVTSGFIIGKKEYFLKSSFEQASYGDYFIYVIRNLKLKKIKMTEVGYICETRKFGISKSGTSFKILFKRALPYFTAAFKVIK